MGTVGEHVTFSGEGYLVFSNTPPNSTAYGPRVEKILPEPKNENNFNPLPVVQDDNPKNKYNAFMQQYYDQLESIEHIKAMAEAKKKIEKLKLTEDEDDKYSELLNDSINMDFPTQPVLLNDRLYNLTDLEAMLEKHPAGMPLDPHSQLPFTRSDIQPVDFKLRVENTITTIKQAREAQKKVEQEALVDSINIEKIPPKASEQEVKITSPKALPMQKERQFLKKLAEELKDKQYDNMGKTFLSTICFDLPFFKKEPKYIEQLRNLFESVLSMHPNTKIMELQPDIINLLYVNVDVILKRAVNNDSHRRDPKVRALYNKYYNQLHPANSHLDSFQLK